MSSGPSSPGNDEIISLAARVQGLEITIRGPANRAWNLARRLSTEQAQGATAEQESLSSGHTPFPACPPDILALATRLSAASVLPPRERVLRAWKLGCKARCLLDGVPFEDQPIVSLDLPSSFFVVLRGNGIDQPKILRRARDFSRALEGAELPGIGQGFPSETETRVYLAGARCELPADR